MKERLTIGCRARVKTLEEKIKQEGPGFFANEDHWRKEYGGREVLLTERSHGGEFSAIVLGKDVDKLEKEKTGIVDNEIAWISEDDLILVNKDFEENLDFIDWYQEHEDDFCPDCLTWRPDSLTWRPDQSSSCPNKSCPSHFEDQILSPLE